MKKISLVLGAVINVAFTFGQSSHPKVREIMVEAKKLYASELASWHGTDVFLARFPWKRKSIGGYTSYSDANSPICVFFDQSSSPRVLASVRFDSTFNVATATVDTTVREPTQLEASLFTIRQIAVAEYQVDPIFKSYNGISPNFIPLIDESGKRVYVLSGPQQSGYVILGNDYMLTFADDDKLIEKKSLHRNLISLEDGRNSKKEIESTAHTHLPETGDYITPTDVCTLLLYSRYCTWKKHIVISRNIVSIFHATDRMLFLVDKNEWEKHNNQTKKKKG